MNLNRALILFLLLFLPAMVDAQNGVEEIKELVGSFNKRLDKANNPDGFFMVVQNKNGDGDKIKSFSIYYETTTNKDKKLKYRLNVGDETSGRYFASVVEDGKVLKITYGTTGGSFTYLVKATGNSLQATDEKGTLVYPPRGEAGKADDQNEKEDAPPDVMPKPSFDLGAYLGGSLHYPEHARLHNITGKVLVKFVINEDGSVSDVELAKGIDDECDKDALRVVSNMPKWIPGQRDGKNVKVYFTLPIMFKLAK